MGESYFDGGLLGLIGISIAAAIISILTFGICVPWAICIRQDWITSHTVINGKRLHFTGTGLGLLGNYIKWFLLTLITLGLYGFWLVIKIKQWEVSHTEFCN